MKTVGKTMLATLVLVAAGGAAVAQGQGMMAGFGDDPMAAEMGGGMRGGMHGGMQGGMGPLAMFDFAAVDADKDGKVTEAEWQAYRLAKVTEADTDKDGTISEAEIKAAAVARMDARMTEMATKMVERLDADGDGALTAAEMAASGGAERMFAKVDADGDGAVTEDEIAAAQERMAEMRGKGKGEGRHGRGHGWFMGGDN